MASQPGREEPQPRRDGRSSGPARSCSRRASARRGCTSTRSARASRTSSTRSSPACARRAPTPARPTIAEFARAGRRRRAERRRLQRGHAAAGRAGERAWSSPSTVRPAPARARSPGRSADRLGLEYLDTGAMYRAVTFAALRARRRRRATSRRSPSWPGDGARRSATHGACVDGVDATADDPHAARSPTAVSVGRRQQRGARRAARPPAAVGERARRRRDRGPRHRLGRVPRRRR